MGNDLLAVKEALPHGKFGPWLKGRVRLERAVGAELMSVAERFEIRKFCGFVDPADRRLPARRPRRPRRGPPGRRREGRGRRGDHLRHGQGDRGRGQEEAATEAAEGGADRQAGPAAGEVAGAYKERWNPKELSELARQLREFADALEKPASGSKKKAKE